MHRKTPYLAYMNAAACPEPIPIKENDDRVTQVLVFVRDV